MGLVTGDAVAVLWYAYALRILLCNLVDNAVKYEPAGGVVEVHVRELPGGLGPAGVELVAEDSGPGIAKDERSECWGASTARPRLPKLGLVPTRSAPSASTQRPTLPSDCGPGTTPSSARRIRGAYHRQ